MVTVLILGSGPMVTAARDWDRAPFDRIVAINNAHQVRTDWDYHIHPWDFPQDRRPLPRRGQHIVTEREFVPAQNEYGGFVYAGGTMAFTAAYWALSHFSPGVIAVYGCDMHYPKGQTHFYGKGSADPLRPDISLRSLEAKSARLMVLAAMQGCAMVNLSYGPTRQVFARMSRDNLNAARPAPFDLSLARAALLREAALGYVDHSGRYWENTARYDVGEIDALDALWLRAAGYVTEPVAAIA